MREKRLSMAFDDVSGKTTLEAGFSRTLRSITEEQYSKAMLTMRWSASIPLFMLMAGCAVVFRAPQARLVPGSGRVDGDRYDWVGPDRVFAYEQSDARWKGDRWETGAADSVPMLLENGTGKRVEIPGLSLEGEAHDVPFTTKDGRAGFYRYTNRSEPLQIVGSPDGCRVLMLLSSDRLQKVRERSAQDAAFHTYESKGAAIWAVIDPAGTLVRKWNVRLNEIDDLDKKGVWSPDGKGFGYLAAQSEAPFLIYRPLMGAIVDRPLVNAPGDASWRWLLGWTKADGLIVRADGYVGSTIERYRLQGAAFVFDRAIALPSRDRWYEPALSPDGKWVFCRAQEERLEVIRISDGLTRVVFPRWTERGSYRWRPDGRTLSLVDEGRLLTFPFDEGKFNGPGEQTR